MGSVTKIKTGYRAFARKNNTRRTRVFRTKTEARDWIRETEYKLSLERHTAHTRATFHDLLDRYLREVSSKKRGFKWERDRIRLIQRDEVAAKKISDVTPSVMADWRDRRLESVSEGSVLREWNLISHAFNIAIKEWGWLQSNPMRAITRPKPPQHRDRLITDKEQELILHTAGYERCPDTITSRMAAAFLFAIETAMRASEIAGIRPEHVDLGKRTCLLPMTKNGTSRNVPLSGEAIRILEQVNCDFGLSASQISSLFRNVRDKSGVVNLRFHDTRHQAITNLARKMDVLDLARMVGIRDLKVLMVYYNQTAEEIAKRL